MITRIRKTTTKPMMLLKHNKLRKMMEHKIVKIGWMKEKKKKKIKLNLYQLSIEL